MGKGRDKRKRRQKKRENKKLPHKITGIDYGDGTDFTAVKLVEFDYTSVERRVIANITSDSCIARGCRICPLDADTCPFPEVRSANKLVEDKLN